MELNIHNAKLLISAVRQSQYPASSVPELALAGRSNVGKSSLINRLLNRKNFARTSATPGKTATINFYEIDQKLHLVDLPGYGFARVSKEEQIRWAKMINTYLDTRTQLFGVLLLVDARHKPTEQDQQMYRWIAAHFGRAAVVATKCDKLRKTQLAENLLLIESALGLSEEDVLIPFSAETGMGKEEVWQEISRITDIAL